MIRLIANSWRPQLKLLGLSSQTAENGKSALEMWRNGKFALIITDYHMPIMDGYQLTQAIRASEFNEENTPHADPGLVSQCAP
ncbi:MAG: response regulator [Nitrosomonas sp.]|nr:response regulator [Nitrosomonas sp.]